MKTSGIPTLWWGWLVVAFVLTALTSLALILFPDAALAMVSATMLGSRDAVFAESDAVRRFVGWLSSFSAAITLAWMVTLLLVVLGPFRRGERWAWQVIAGSIIIWFIVDTARSIELGFLQNALLNLVWLAIYLVPLIATFRRFHGKGTTMLRERDATV